jgi:uncharacterized protein YcaQ
VGARYIGEGEAREKLLELYFQSVGAAQMRDLRKFFRWGNPVTDRAVKRLVKREQIAEGVTREDKVTRRGKSGAWLALKDLIA